MRIQHKNNKKIHQNKFTKINHLNLEGWRIDDLADTIEQLMYYITCLDLKT
jgi:hypothetical protein